MENFVLEARISEWTTIEIDVVPHLTSSLLLTSSLCSPQVLPSPQVCSSPQVSHPNSVTSSLLSPQDCSPTSALTVTRSPKPHQISQVQTYLINGVHPNIVHLLDVHKKRHLIAQVAGPYLKDFKKEQAQKANI